jgi:hypothetical protein
MTKNPFLNALAACAYIVALVSAIFYGGPFLGAEDTVFIPMAMLSLFVFSAALMGYIFLYQPIAMFIDGQKKEAVTLFLSTSAIFGGITMVLFILQLVASRGI